MVCPSPVAGESAFARNHCCRLARDRRSWSLLASLDIKGLFDIISAVRRLIFGSRPRTSFAFLRAEIISDNEREIQMQRKVLARRQTLGASLPSSRPFRSRLWVFSRLSSFVLLDTTVRPQHSRSRFRPVCPASCLSLGTFATLSSRFPDVLLACRLYIDMGRDNSHASECATRATILILRLCCVASNVAYIVPYQLSEPQSLPSLRRHINRIILNCRALSRTRDERHSRSDQRNHSSLITTRPKKAAANALHLETVRYQRTCA